MAKRHKWQASPNRIELQYLRALRRVNRQITTALSNVTEPQKAIRIIKQVAQSGPMKELYEASALNMVNNVYRQGKTQWRQAVRASPQVRALYASLEGELQGTAVGDTFYNLFWEHVGQIKSVPEDVAAELADYVTEQSRKGVRSSEIMKELRQMYPEASETALQTLARTQTSKAGTAFTRARAENLGLDWYIWRTSKDSRVRSAHDIMDGVLVPWKSPPCPERLAGEKRTYGEYHAGDIFNCRCYAEPVVDIGFVRFPCKVYFNGKIQTMTKAQFERITA